MKTAKDMELQLVDFFNAAASRALREATDWPYSRQYALHAAEIINQIIESRAMQLRTDDKKVDGLNEIGYSLIEDKLTSVYEAISKVTEIFDKMGCGDAAMQYRELCAHVYGALVKVQTQRQWEENLKGTARPAPRKGSVTKPEPRGV